jgi:hypothetical protein
MQVHTIVGEVKFGKSCGLSFHILFSKNFGFRIGTALLLFGFLALKSVAMSSSDMMSELCGLGSLKLAITVGLAKVLDLSI